MKKIQRVKKREIATMLRNKINKKFGYRTLNMDTSIGVMNALEEIYYELLGEGKSLKIHGLINMNTGIKEPKHCRNPFTGEQIMSKRKMATKVSKTNRLKLHMEKIKVGVEND